MSLAHVLVALSQPSPDEVLALIESEVERRTTIATGGKGSVLTLPPGMDKQAAIKYLQKKIDEEEKIISLRCEFKMFPLDVARAIKLALEEKYNATMEDRMGFWGPQPPVMLTVKTGLNQTEEVPWGDFSIAGVEGKFHMQMQQISETDFVFVLAASLKGKYAPMFNELVEAVKKKLKDESIYRGKAIKVDFRDDDGELQPVNQDFEPEFMDLTVANKAIFNRMTERQIDTSIFTPIRFTEKLRQQKMSLRRTILLDGKFGTGKTLTAALTAKLCVENGWTFISVMDPRDLARARHLAKMFGPTVVFCEDIDRVMRGERTVETDKVLNQLDGIDTKDMEVITILTTNDSSAIQMAMRRPGRIDDVIRIEVPDAETCVRLLRHYGGSILQGDDGAFERALTPVIGMPPAMIREVIDRAKLAAISRDGEMKITAADVDVAAHTMKDHIDFMKGDLGEEPGPSGVEILAGEIADQLAKRNGHLEEALA